MNTQSYLAWISHISFNTILVVISTYEYICCSSQQPKKHYQQRHRIIFKFNAPKASGKDLNARRRWPCRVARHITHLDWQQLTCFRISHVATGFDDVHRDSAIHIYAGCSMVQVSALWSYLTIINQYSWLALYNKHFEHQQHHSTNEHHHYLHWTRFLSLWIRRCPNNDVFSHGFCSPQHKTLTHHPYRDIYISRVHNEQVVLNFCRITVTAGWSNITSSNLYQFNIYMTKEFGQCLRRISNG